MRVYHFLPEAFALDDLRRRRLKVSRLEDLNDPFELLALALPSRKHRLAVARWKQELDSLWGVLCFSRRWRDPMLWSHYADKHRGICLGFDVPKTMVIPVQYNANRLAVALDRQLHEETLDEKLGLTLFSTKYEGWKYEDEVRLAVSLNEADPRTGLYFFEFGDQLRVRQVILGPRSTLSKADAEAALAVADKKAQIIKGRLAFKTFTVVQQRNAALW